MSKPSDLPVASAPPPAPAPSDKKKPPTIDEVVSAELARDQASLGDADLLMSEHAAKLEPWQVKAILARFHAQGLRINSRVSPAAFKAAADATLKGRV